MASAISGFTISCRTRLRSINEFSAKHGSRPAASPVNLEQYEPLWDREEVRFFTIENFEDRIDMPAHSVCLFRILLQICFCKGSKLQPILLSVSSEPKRAGKFRI